MRHILFSSIVLSFTFQLAYAEKIIEDVVPTSAPKWACPSSVKIGNVEYRNLISVAVFTDPPENLFRLAPEPRKHIKFRFSLTEENVYFTCGYEGLETKLIIHAKGATFCGDSETPHTFGCWDGQPPPN